jgi:hypothetical protein
MNKLWLKVRDDGVIAQSLFTPEEDPEGYNFVVEDLSLIASLREKLSNWHVKDDQLCRRIEIKLIITPSKEGRISANGIDHFIIAVEECPFDMVKLKYGSEEVELPTDDVFHLKSTVPTKVELYVDEMEYATLRTVYLEFI